MGKQMNKWVHMNVLRVYPHFGSPTSQGMSAESKKGQLEGFSRGLAVSSSVLEPDGSFPAWTFGANFRT